MALVHPYETFTTEEPMADRLLHLPEIAEKTTMSLDTLRWKWHQHQLPFLFKLGRRIVAHESDVDAWIAEQKELTSRK
ncbi:MAG: helix-turn-helix transcriptional regulator [Hyphomicrobiales bacterium]